VNRYEKPGLDWLNVVFISAVHAAAFLALAVPFYWSTLWMALALWWITGSLGIGLGFHRLLTHQGFRSRRWLQRMLAICGTLAVQGGPIDWVAGHRMHHAHSDRDLDPHNSRRGFWWAHVGWIFYRDPKLGKFENYSRYAKDLCADPFLVFLDRWYFLVQLALGFLLFAWGGWSLVVWGIFVRLVFGWHCTWLVNSAAHKFGYQSYESRDESRNCWWVALLTFGEGWHNNHHAFPRSARHGLRWWEFDTNYIIIRVLNSLRLVWDVRAQEHLKKERKADLIRRMGISYVTAEGSPIQRMGPV
jgi:sn-1 stearoyl-lipid 9-desaturase